MCILIRVRIDQRFGCEPTQTGYKWTEFGRETTMGTKRLDTLGTIANDTRFIIVISCS